MSKLLAAFIIYHISGREVAAYEIEKDRSVDLSVCRRDAFTAREDISAKTVIEPTQASGTAVEENEMCIIDYSHADLGYVMIKVQTEF